MNSLQKYIWPCFVVWGLDRLIRVMRIVFFSLSPILFSSKKYTGEVKCDVISDDTLRLTVPQPPHFHWSPGQHVNIAMPGAFRYLWHPFTIATLDRGYNRVTVSDKEKGVSESEGKSAGMQFFINVRSGSTRRLAEYVRRDNLSKMKIFVDGPYGLPPRLEGFDNCVLLAGMCSVFESVFKPINVTSPQRWYWGGVYVAVVPGRDRVREFVVLLESCPD